MTVDPIRRLLSMGRDLSNIPLSHFKEARKVAFICVNCYKSYRGNLGVAPINDCVQFAKLIKTFDFEVFILQTPHQRNFLTVLEKILEKTTEQLIFFYAGQPLVDLDPNDGIDEYHFEFDDGVVAERDLAQRIVDFKNPNSELYLITQREHKGSIFDIGDGNVLGVQLPPKCFSFTCIRDFNSLTQTLTMDNDQGAFTFHLCKQLRGIKDCSALALQAAMKKTIESYGHVLALGMTSPELGEKPMFRPDID